MFRARRSPIDSTTLLLREGYLWLPERRRQASGAPVSARLGGMRVTALSGPEALEFFYDENHIHRAGAIPGPIRAPCSATGPCTRWTGRPTAGANPSSCP